MCPDDFVLYRNREDAGKRLAECFEGRTFQDPLVLAIPRGGVPVGEVLAEALGAELDVVLVRKLRSPDQPELALGAISEGGKLYLNQEVLSGFGEEEIRSYLEQEKAHQLKEIARRQRLIRQVRPRASIRGRSVIVADDGIATGSTIIAALQLLRPEKPAELLVAAPVCSPRQLEAVERYCDEVVCPCLSESFSAVGQFYEDFSQVEDDDVVKILARTYQVPKVRSEV